MQHLFATIFFLTLNVSAHHTENRVHNNEKITYFGHVGPFLDISNMFSVKSLVKHCKSSIHELPAMKLTAWKFDVIGSIFHAVPPAGSDWRLMQNQGKSRPKYLRSVDLKEFYN
jgi:hypothetical protein